MKMVAKVMEDGCVGEAMEDGSLTVELMLRARMWKRS